MKPSSIFKCSVCGIKLNGFEAGKWKDLVEFWGDRIGNRTPKCSVHYNDYINARSRMGKATYHTVHGKASNQAGVGA